MIRELARILGGYLAVALFVVTIVVVAIVVLVLIALNSGPEVAG